MALATGNSIHGSRSRPQLDVSGAAIQRNFEERDPSFLLPNQSDDISALALELVEVNEDTLLTSNFKEFRLESSSNGTWDQQNAFISTTEFDEQQQQQQPQRNPSQQQQQQQPQVTWSNWFM